MATITKTIGTAGRDHSSITLWEANLDNGAEYSSGDDAVGECYNDSVFNEKVLINGGSTVGLSSITLRAASGERHDGTAGTGARISQASASNAAYVNNGGSIQLTVEWLEIGGGGTTNNFDNSGVINSGTSGINVKNCIIHDLTATGGGDCDGIHHQSGSGADSGDILNNIIYDCSSASGGDEGIFVGTLSTHTYNVYNNTVYNCDGTGIDLVASSISRNNIAMDCGTDFSTSNGSNSNNMSSDATAPGGSSLTSQTTADQFVSTVGGSEDLHLKTGSDAIGAGADLGTSPSGVEVDINGRDRDAEGDTWDIGAHQFVSGGGALTLDADNGTFTLTGQTVGLTADLSIAAEHGDFVLSGQTVALAAGNTLIAENGSFTFTGQVADLELARSLTAEHGVFTLTGQDVLLTYTENEFQTRVRAYIVGI